VKVLVCLKAWMLQRVNRAATIRFDGLELW